MSHAGNDELKEKEFEDEYPYEQKQDRLMVVFDVINNLDLLNDIITDLEAYVEMKNRFSLDTGQEVKSISKAKYLFGEQKDRMYLHEAKCWDNYTYGYECREESATCEAKEGGHRMYAERGGPVW